MRRKQKPKERKFARVNKDINAKAEKEEKTKIPSKYAPPKSKVIGGKESGVKKK